MNTRTMLKWCGGIVLAFAILFTLAHPLSSYAEEDINAPHTPAYYLKRVFEIGTEIGNPETLQAILMQESKGIKHAVGNPKAPLSQRSYGLMQVQLGAARSILQRQPDLLNEIFPDRTLKSIKDPELAEMLIHNDEANIRIAAYHFNLYLKLCKGNWHKAVAAYNVGIGGVQNISNPAEYSYVREIKRKMDRIIKPFNTRNELLSTAN